MLKKALVVVGLLGLVGIGTSVYLYQQVTDLPDWYEEGEASQNWDPAPSSPSVEWVDSEDDRDEDAVTIPQTVKPPPASAGAAPAPKKKRRPKQEIRNFHLKTMAKNKALHKAVKGSRATMKDGTLEAGVVISLSEIPKNKLATADRKLLDRAMKTFPALKGKKVYIGLNDIPKEGRDGILQLGPDTEVKIGKLSYTLRKATKLLGISEAQVRGQINRELRRMKVRAPD